MDACKKGDSGIQDDCLGEGKKENLGRLGMDGCGKGQAHRLGSASNMQSEPGCFLICLSPESFT